MGQAGGYSYYNKQLVFGVGYKGVGGKLIAVASKIKFWVPKRESEKENSHCERFNPCTLKFHRNQFDQ